jgi:hypothetical protein
MIMFNLEVRNKIVLDKYCLLASLEGVYMLNKIWSNHQIQFIYIYIYVLGIVMQLGYPKGKSHCKRVQFTKFNYGLCSSFVLYA